MLYTPPNVTQQPSVEIWDWNVIAQFKDDKFQYNRLCGRHGLEPRVSSPIVEIKKIDDGYHVRSESGRLYKLIGEQGCGNNYFIGLLRDAEYTINILDISTLV